MSEMRFSIFTLKTRHSSVGGFQDLPKQFGRIFTSKERNRCNILPVKLDGLTQETGNRGRLCRSGIGKLQVC